MEEYIVHCFYDQVEGNLGELELYSYRTVLGEGNIQGLGPGVEERAVTAYWRHAKLPASLRIL